MDRAEYVELLKGLGHFNAAAVKKPNGRFYVTCECGYQSTTRINLRECVDTLEHHRRKVLKEARAQGVSLPGSRRSNL